MTATALAVNTARSIHRAGAVCLVAGLGGAGATIYLAMASPVGGEGFTYPHGAPDLTGLQMLVALGFLIVTLAAAWAAWLVWNGSKSGGVLALALLPAEAAFWYGFSLPRMLGLARVILLVTARASLSWQRTLTPAGR